MEELYVGVGLVVCEIFGGVFGVVKKLFEDLLGSGVEGGIVWVVIVVINGFVDNLGVIVVVVLLVGVVLGIFYVGGKLVVGLKEFIVFWMVYSVVVNWVVVGFIGMIVVIVWLIIV